MKILKIAAKGDTKVVISFDDGSDLTALKELVYKRGLRKGDELTAEAYRTLLRDNDQALIREQAFRFLARRLHSAGELRMKLLKKQYDEILIQEIIADFRDKEYLDDYKFAVEYAAERSEKKKYGERKIRAELMQRGVDRQIIDKALAAGLSENAAEENALELARKKLRALEKRNLDKNILKRRLFSFLQGRGFDFETIKGVVESLIDENQE